MKSNSRVFYVSMILIVLLVTSAILFRREQEKQELLKRSVPAYFQEMATEDDEKEQQGMADYENDWLEYCHILRVIENEFDLEGVDGDTLAMDKQLSEIYSYACYSSWASSMGAIRALRTQLTRFMELPISQGYSFPELESSISLLQPENNAFRLVSYDNMQGGTMRFYDTYVQYVDSVGALTFAQFDVASTPDTCVGANNLYWHIEQLPVEDDETAYYLLISRGQGSTLISWYDVEVVSFENGVFTYYDSFFPEEVYEQFGTGWGLHFDFDKYELKDEDGGLDEELELKHDFYYNRQTGVFTVGLIGEEELTFTLTNIDTKS